MLQSTSSSASSLVSSEPVSGAVGVRPSGFFPARSTISDETVAAILALAVHRGVSPSAPRKILPISA